MPRISIMLLYVSLHYCRIIIEKKSALRGADTQSTWCHVLQLTLDHCGPWKFWHSTLTITTNVDYTLDLHRSTPFSLIGNSVMFCSCRHCIKWPLIVPWSKKHLPGFFPLAKAVANAMANSPQSEHPSCICTSMYLTWIVYLGVQRIAAIQLWELEASCRTC